MHWQTHSKKERKKARKQKPVTSSVAHSISFTLCLCLSPSPPSNFSVVRCNFAFRLVGRSTKQMPRYIHSAHAHAQQLLNIIEYFSIAFCTQHFHPFCSSTKWPCIIKSTLGSKCFANFSHFLSSVSVSILPFGSVLDARSQFLILNARKCSYC